MLPGITGPSRLLYHHFVYLRAVIFIQRDESGYRAVPSVAAAEDLYELRYIFFLCPELFEILRHAYRDKIIPEHRVRPETILLLSV